MNILKISGGVKMKHIKKPSRMLVNTINQLHSKETGKIVAIEPFSKKYFIGQDIIDAYEKAIKMFPDRLFFFIRIGYRAADSQAGYYKPSL